MEERAYKIKVNGDSGVSVEFCQDISIESNCKVHTFAKHLTRLKVPGIACIVPSYCELLINYNPIIITYQELENWLLSSLKNIDDVCEKVSEVVHIPVLYGGEYGLDIERVAKENELSVDELIAIHTRPYYRVYMLGFKPGFPYLGGMSKKLATPRLKSPRLKVAAGSVGIAGEQTGIYPQESPGGWQLIGHTPLSLLDWSSEELTLVKAGQYIKFKSVDQASYNQIKKEIDAGTYAVFIETLKGVGL